ncbi:MAG TPA: AMMECR1 domain-containing protein [Anaerolineaceae bacterium]|jgi:AmmeMemoRadiSam system protein A|nr:AMMECR1 domain-containing protein [Anaerolineaceae bacterium]
MNTTPLTASERESLLKLARRSIEAAVAGKPVSGLPPEEITTALTEKGASFVTLTIGGNLRGCIGALEAYQPLMNDVQEHAVAAAMEDFRFPPVSRAEVPHLEIEVSRLTPPQRLEYSQPLELLNLLKPGIDGVVLRDGPRRATFLPQVWEKIPDAADFLSELCAKMGARYDLWRTKKLEVFTYQVEEFHE